jgi:uncharacterized protein YndB with AHSA1/START domain
MKIGGFRMATSRVTPGADEIIIEIHIAAPPERVFQAISDPRQIPQWWGQTGMYRCTEASVDLRVGGKWRNGGVTGESGQFDAHGEYLEIDPPRLLVHTWIASWTGDVKTIVRWELEPSKGGTLVRIRHTGLAAHPGLSESYKGWPTILSWLRDLLERGETVADRKTAKPTW